MIIINGLIIYKLELTELFSRKNSAKEAFYRRNNKGKLNKKEK